MICTSKKQLQKYQPSSDWMLIKDFSESTWRGGFCDIKKISPSGNVAFKYWCWLNVDTIHGDCISQHEINPDANEFINYYFKEHDAGVCCARRFYVVYIKNEDNMKKILDRIEQEINLGYTSIDINVKDILNEL